jgi:uncharacterized damage-inducible protein DinB
VEYGVTAIGEADVPVAKDSTFQHLLDTYASETNKVYATWLAFTEADFDFRPHPKSSTVVEIVQHQILSERRFFAEFLGVPEPPPTELLPRVTPTMRELADRFVELAQARLQYLAKQEQAWWLALQPFFDVHRERIWIFWRRVLHTAHHRTQLTMYLRFLDRPVPATYGPTSDVTWTGADPTLTVEAAGRAGTAADSK